MPWGGVIAGKRWGKKDGQHKFLALHGWMDNCGTFDALFEIFFSTRSCNDIEIIAIDYPGHGKSSHTPNGLIPHMQLDYVYDIARVVNALKWQQFNFIGHSLGGNISLTYAGVFPGQVQSVFTVESVGMYLWGTGEDPSDYQQSLAK